MLPILLHSNPRISEFESQRIGAKDVALERQLQKALKESVEDDGNVEEKEIITSSMKVALL
jgi:hypothetical protein